MLSQPPWSKYTLAGQTMDIPLLNPDLEIYMDGSSFAADGEQKAGYATVTLQEELET